MFHWNMGIMGDHGYGMEKLSHKSHPDLWNLRSNFNLEIGAEGWIGNVFYSRLIAVAMGKNCVLYQ